jgi:hypothetical protein
VPEATSISAPINWFLQIDELLSGVAQMVIAGCYREQGIDRENGRSIAFLGAKERQATAMISLIYSVRPLN